MVVGRMCDRGEIRVASWIWESQQQWLLVVWWLLRAAQGSGSLQASSSVVSQCGTAAKGYLHKRSAIRQPEEAQCTFLVGS
jgi:hypothetical protein